MNLKSENTTNKHTMWLRMNHLNDVVERNDINLDTKPREMKAEK